MRYFVLVIALLGIAVAAAVPAAAGRYDDGSTVAYTYADRDGDGTLSWNDDITLTATPPTGIVYGDLGGTCYQGWRSESKPGTLVRSFYSFTDDRWTRTYRLDSAAWTDGTGASCRFYGVYSANRKSYTFGDVYVTVAP